jgi:hypothetical protein
MHPAVKRGEAQINGASTLSPIDHFRHRLVGGAAILVVPKVPEAPWCEFGVAHRRLNGPMT